MVAVLPIGASQYLISDDEFWGGLSVDELNATVLSRLKQYVSFDEIVDACVNSEKLVVIEFLEHTMVGRKVGGLPMPGGWMSIEDFESKNSALWAIVPKDGCSIDYVEDQQCNGKTIISPWLGKLANARGSGGRELLHAITEALSLRRASVDMSLRAVTYY